LSAIKAINLGPAFCRFVEASAHRSPDDALALWDEQVEGVHQALFADFVWYKDKVQDWRQRKQLRLKGALPLYQRRLGEIRASFEAFEASLGDHVERFRTAGFRDFAIEVPVFALPSVDAFNGKLASAGDNGNVLAFGLDRVVLQAVPEDVNYAHELFHVHHIKKLGDSETWDQTAKMSLPLWIEGFATYASGLMCPKRDESEILLSRDFEDITSQIRRSVAASYLSDVDALAWADGSWPTYSKWLP
jgi:hypothetical protein